MFVGYGRVCESFLMMRIGGWGREGGGRSGSASAVLFKRLCRAQQGKENRRFQKSGDKQPVSAAYARPRCRRLVVGVHPCPGMGGGRWGWRASAESPKPTEVIRSEPFNERTCRLFTDHIRTRCGEAQCHDGQQAQ